MLRTGKQARQLRPHPSTSCRAHADHACAQVWEASAKRSALGIRQAELNFHIERYGALIGQCSFLAGFSFESIVHLEVPEDTSYVISSIFFVSLSLAVMCSVYVVVVGSGLIIFGHQLALMGSEGESLELAVHHLRERRFSVFLAGFTAFFSLISAAVALCWIKMGPIAIYVSLTFGFMMIWTFRSLWSIWHDIGNRQLVTGETKFYTPK